jgi:AcrR family transcriptional regulator
LSIDGPIIALVNTRTKRTKQRLTADQRREDLLEAAIVEFARRGYHATTTADIARAAGVSQPYIYALFQDKRTLFLACHERTTERIATTLERARREAGPDDDLEVRLGQAYNEMVEARPEQILFQMQARAAASADPEIRGPVREHWIELVDESVRLHGRSRQAVMRYIAWALLHDVAIALDLPDDYRPEPYRR